MTCSAYSIIRARVWCWCGIGNPWSRPWSNSRRRSKTLTNRELRNKERKIYCTLVDPEKPKDLFTCQNYRGKKRDIILWGDSHALHLVAGFSEVYPDYNIFVLYLSGCVPQSGFGSFIHGLSSSDASKRCSIRNQKALAYLRSAKPSTVIVSSAKRSKPEVIAPPTLDILSELSEAGHKAFVIGDFIRPGRHLLNCMSVPDWVLSDEHIRNRCVGDPEKMAEELAYNEKISGLVEGFINTNDLHCPGGRCVFLDGSKVLFRDEHHLSSHGAIYFISRLKDRLPIEAK